MKAILHDIKPTGTTKIDVEIPSDYNKVVTFKGANFEFAKIISGEPNFVSYTETTPATEIVAPTSVLERWKKYPILSGKAWRRGTIYWNDDALDTYQKVVGLLDAAGGGSKGATGQYIKTWDDVINEQGNFGHSTNFSAAVKVMKPAQGIITWVIVTIPIERRTDTGNGSVWKEIARGDHDEFYIRWGKKIAETFAVLKQPLDLLVLRLNHEMNQSNTYQVFENTKMDYKAAMERTIDKMREGAKFPLVFAHAPARTERLGSYESWMPSNVDVLSISFHPNNTVVDRKSFDKFLEGPDARSYGINEVITLARKIKKPVAFLEWSPRNEEILGCPITDQVYQWVYELFDANKDILLCEQVHSPATITPSRYDGPGGAEGKAAWARGVEVYKRLWAGKKV